VVSDTGVRKKNIWLVVRVKLCIQTKLKVPWMFLAGTSTGRLTVIEERPVLAFFHGGRSGEGSALVQQELDIVCSGRYSSTSNVAMKGGG